MGRQPVICKKCGKSTVEGSSRRKYCNDCYGKELMDNINNNTTKYYLLPSVFNKSSKFSTKAYVIYLKKFGINDWIDVIKYYNLETKIMDELCELIHLVKNKYNSISVTDACRILNFNNMLFKKLDYDYIENKGIIITRHNITNEDIEKEYRRIISECGHIPLYTSYFKMSRFTSQTCKKALGSKVDKIYEEMIRIYSGESELELYSKKNKEHKSQNGKRFSGINKHTDEDLINRFKKMVDEYVLKYGEIPSSKILSKMHKFDLKIYKTRFGKNYSELINEIGYKYEDSKLYNRSEKSCLNHISNILNEGFLPQAKFDWLVGINGYPLFCDGYYKKHNLIVEFNGAQHYKPNERFGGIDSFNILKRNDEEKKRLCEEYGFIFLTIKSSQPWYKEDWMRRKLKEYKVI